MSKVEYSEVDSLNLIENKSLSDDSSKTIDRGELGLQEETSEDSLVHAYIAFEEGVSIEDGIAAIQKQVLKNQTLSVTRKDESGNAIVAIVARGQLHDIANLEQVCWLREEKTAQTTTNDSEAQTQNQVNENQDSQTEESKESADNISTGESAQDTPREQLGETQQGGTTTEIKEDSIDTTNNPGYQPIVLGVLLVLAVVLGILYIKRDRG